MTVARDAVLEFATFTTTSPATLSFTPTGTARGVTVHVVVNGAATDQVTGVTYGGVAMARVAWSQDQVTETGAVVSYHLGAGIPTGAQTVSIAHTGTAQTKWAVVQSVTAAADTEVGTLGLINRDRANPSILLGSGALSALRVGVMWSGFDDIASVAPLTGVETPTTADSHDFGTATAYLVQQTTASTGEFTLGFTAVSEDCALVGFTVQEVVADGFPHTVAPAITNLIGGTSHLVVMPPVVTAGDLLIMQVGSPPRVITTPTDWTLLSNAEGAASELTWFYKIAAGTEGGTTVDVVFSVAGNLTAFVYRISNWHGTTPPEVGTAVVATTANPNPPSLTPSWGVGDTLWMAGVVIAGSDRHVTVYPTDFDNGLYIYQEGSSTTTLTNARRDLNAATENPGTFTSTSDVTVSQTVAIRAAIPPNTGTVAAVQAVQVGAAAGTVTPPTPPPSGGGTRMGGDGAIRRHPTS